VGLIWYTAGFLGGRLVPFDSQPSQEWALFDIPPAFSAVRLVRLVRVLEWAHLYTAGFLGGALVSTR
jgi:hypothetical protein